MENSVLHILPFYIYYSVYFSGSWIQCGREVDVFDDLTGVWWQGLVKRITENAVDPEVTISYQKCLPETVHLSSCKGQCQFYTQKTRKSLFILKRTITNNK